MKRFTQLYMDLDSSNRTNDKIEALRSYFAETPPADAAWAVYFLVGSKIPRAVNSTQLRRWISEAAQLPEWLVDESYSVVGDLAETIALLLPPVPANDQDAKPADSSDDVPLSTLVEQQLMPLRDLPETDRRDAIMQAWHTMDRNQRFVYNKLITGAFRVGVSKTLVIKALSQHFNVTPAVMAHRLMGAWTPTAEAFLVLAHESSMLENPARPYPFYLASPLPDDFTATEKPDDFQAEWKWDGIRCQLIKRLGQVILWSRGEDLLTDRFPEVRDAAASQLPDGTVLDGEILAWDVDKPAPFQNLQPRISRKSISQKMLQSTPAVFMAYDLLEIAGEDVRDRPLSERRTELEALASEWPQPESDDAPSAPVTQPALILSPIIRAATWDEYAAQRAQSRDLRTEGLMLKRHTSPYRSGRVRGDWWKWKVDPYTIDAVLTYAQPGHGRRAGLFTDYTFGVWGENDQLITIAKAYSGLSNEEINQVDNWVRKNTLEKFGPVRMVKPVLVFELAFEGLQLSSRNKSGIAVRFPRISRWRRDKPPEQADTLDRVKELLAAHTG